jgi:lipopolysaccharide export system protein LptA
MTGTTGRATPGRGLPAALALLAITVLTAPALAQQGRTNNPLGSFGGTGGGPIKVDANRLEVFDRESKAVYSGDVVAVRGKTTLRGSRMTIFYARQENGQGQPTAAAGQQGNSIRKIEVDGPVSVACETQYATADRMVYDAAAKRVILTGRAVVGDGPANVLTGEEIVYDTERGVATARGGGRQGRVSTVIDQGQQQARPQQDTKANGKNGC